MKVERKWWTLANASISVLMVLLDVTIVNVALPTLQSDLHAKFSSLQWIVNAYALPLAVVLVTGGRLGDIYGRRKLFVIGTGIFVAGSALAGLSGDVHFGRFPQLDALLFARAVEGLGAAVMMPVSLAMVSQAFPGKEKGVAVGIWGAMSGLGLAAGPIVGGLLIVTLGWPYIFYLNLPIGLLSIAASFVTIDESRDENAPRRIDWIGMISLSLFVLTLVWGLIRLEDLQHGSFLTAAWPFAVSAASLASFVWIERRIDYAMVDLNLFRNRSFTGDAISVFTLASALVAFIFFLTLYLQNALGFDPLQTGIHLLPMTILVGFCAPVAGRFTYRVGPRWIISGGLALGAIGAYLASRITPADSQAQWTVLVPSFVLFGLGLGSANAPINTVAVGTAEPGKAGVASGIVNVCRQIGTAFGIAVLGLLLTRHYDSAVMAHHFPKKIVREIRAAGTQAGSSGLRQAPKRVKKLPVFPEISHATRDAWVNSFADTVKVGAYIVAIGAVLAALMIRKRDLREEKA